MFGGWNWDLGLRFVLDQSVTIVVYDQKSHFRTRKMICAVPFLSRGQRNMMGTISSGIWPTRPGVLLHWVSATSIWWSKSLLPCWRWQSWFHKSWRTWPGVVLRRVSWMLTSWRRFPGNPSKLSENLWRRTRVSKLSRLRSFRMFYHFCFIVFLNSAASYPSN